MPITLSPDASTRHVAREDYLPDLWPLCRNDMGSDRYREVPYPVNCVRCRTIVKARKSL